MISIRPRACIQNIAILLTVFVTLEASAQTESNYMRLGEDRDGTLRLELSVRTFEHEDGGPAVLLVGVAHIAEEEYYDEVQKLLDESGLVLYEGVAPGWRDVGDDASHTRRRFVTTDRIRFVATQVEVYRAARGRLPRSLDDVRASMPSYEARMFDVASTDAWGNPISLSFGLGGKTFDLVSTGADGKPDGFGLDADLRWSDDVPLDPAEIEPAAGLQIQLAKAAGLRFQLDAMDYSSPAWVNSDTTIDELIGGPTTSRRPAQTENASGAGDRAAAQDVEKQETKDQTEAVLGMLSGESMVAKVAGGVLKFVGLLPQGRTMLQLTLIELLSKGEELLAAGPLDDAFMEKLIDNRNRAVMRDLDAAIRDRPDVGSIAIFYGAAHLPDFEQRLTERGYAPTETRWLSAIHVTPGEAGISRSQMTSFRRTLSTMIDQQLKMLEELDG